MSRHYIGEIGTVITVDCGEDISAATNTKFKVKKPDGTEIEWSASIYNTNYLQYTTINSDLNQYGEYIIQSSLTISGWTGLGDADSFIIYNEYA